MKIGENCLICDGFMQITESNPQIGDELVCTGCDSESKITDLDFPIVRGADILLMCGNTQKKCHFCGVMADVVFKSQTSKGTEEHEFCKSCVVGLVLENL